MPFIPVTNVAQFNVRGTYLGEQVENTLYVRSTSAWTPLTLQDAATSVSTWWAGSVLPLLSNNYVYRETYAVDLTTVASPTATETPVGTQVGGTSGDPLPGNVSLCVSFRTASRGRSFRGRNYVCGLVEPNVSGNTISPTWSESVVLAYQLLAVPDEIFPPAFTWGVVSRFTNNQPRSSGVFTPITQVLVVDNFVDSQRRRLPGRGR